MVVAAAAGGILVACPATFLRDSPASRKLIRTCSLLTTRWTAAAAAAAARRPKTTCPATRREPSPSRRRTCQKLVTFTRRRCPRTCYPAPSKRTTRAVRSMARRRPWQRAVRCPTSSPTTARPCQLLLAFTRAAPCPELSLTARLSRHRAVRSMARRRPRQRAVRCPSSSPTTARQCRGLLLAFTRASWCCLALSPSARLGRHGWSPCQHVLVSTRTLRRRTPLRHRLRRRPARLPARAAARRQRHRGPSSCNPTPGLFPGGSGAYPQVPAGHDPRHARGTCKPRRYAATATRRIRRSGAQARTGGPLCATRVGYATRDTGWCRSTGRSRLLASGAGSTPTATGTS
jgi:hypothetical protein